MRDAFDLIRWSATLSTGGTLEVWADGYSLEDRAYVFSKLVDLGDGEPLPENAEGPASDGVPRRCWVVVARLPLTSIRHQHGEPEIFSLG